MSGTFIDGVNWGKFSVTMTEDEPKYENARLEVLMAVTDLIDTAPGIPVSVLRRTMTDAWFAYLCHGTLSRGQLCPTCGTQRSEDD